MTFCADGAAHIKVPSVSYFFFFFSLSFTLTHPSAHVYFCSSLGLQHVTETPGMLTYRVFLLLVKVDYDTSSENPQDIKQKQRFFEFKQPSVEPCDRKLKWSIVLCGFDAQPI